MTSAVDRQLRLELPGGRHLARRTVVMVASPAAEPTRAEVVLNLATVCAEIGQRVAVVTTSGVEAYDGGTGALAAAGPVVSEDGDRRLIAPLKVSDVQGFLDETQVPGVSLLDLRHFVAHPTQVVIRVPGVLSALREIVDVVILDVPSFLTVHHGQALAPLTDVVLVVGQRRLTTLDELRRTRAILKRLGAPVVGMALTADGGSEEDDEPAVADEWDNEWDNWEEGSFWRSSKPSTDEPPTDQPQEGPATLADDTAVMPGTHRRRRTVVDHAPFGLGTRSEQPADADAPTLPEA
jgi:Mrp family chromosome partitioning ATPase